VFKRSKMCLDLSRFSISVLERLLVCNRNSLANLSKREFMVRSRKVAETGLENKQKASNLWRPRHWKLVQFPQQTRFIYRSTGHFCCSISPNATIPWNTYSNSKCCNKLSGYQSEVQCLSLYLSECREGI
jgi:hypothetical protein